MFLKSEEVRAPATQAASTSRLRLRSLRLRLVIWYGALLTVALLFFTVLVWLLSSDALSQSVDSSIRAEARVAQVSLSRELYTSPPYWPAQLSLQALNTYQEPGVVLEVIDTKGELRYDSDHNDTTNIPFTSQTMAAILAGQERTYTTNVGVNSVRVEALPVRAPLASAQNGATDSSGPIIGMLLVAKSLSEVNGALLLLQTVLLLVGGGIVMITLLSGWIIAQRALTPLADLVRTARAITAQTARGRIGNLGQRVPRPGGRDEMAQIVDTFNEMLSNLERASQAQQRFVADASHELRAPLTTIQGNLAFLQRHVDELPADERHTMLADAHSETLRLARLVDELLLLARADANTDKTDMEPEEQREEPPALVELDHAVLQLLRQMRIRLQAEEVPVRLEVGHVEPLRVRGDEESIRRVVLILLDNAIKYTPHDTSGQTGRITVSLEKVGQEAVVRVRDTGIGIAPEDLPHIFERFYRADRARSRAGTGLGLAIASTLVEQLGGRISAESTPGQGSIFSVWLPLAQ